MEIIIWIIVVPLAVGGLAAWMYRIPDRGPMPAPVRRLFHHAQNGIRRCRPGREWESGEHELYHTSLRGVSVNAVDGHYWIMRRATCVVTSRHIVVRDTDGRKLEIQVPALRCVRTLRTFDQGAAATYAVILEQVGSDTHLPEGDVRLLCAGPQECLAIETAISSVTPSPVST